MIESTTNLFKSVIDDDLYFYFSHNKIHHSNNVIWCTCATVRFSQLIILAEVEAFSRNQTFFCWFFLLHPLVSNNVLSYSNCLRTNYNSYLYRCIWMYWSIWWLISGCVGERRQGKRNKLLLYFIIYECFIINLHLNNWDYVTQFIHLHSLSLTPNFNSNHLVVVAKNGSLFIPKIIQTINNEEYQWIGSQLNGF